MANKQIELILIFASPNDMFKYKDSSNNDIIIQNDFFFIFIYVLLSQGFLKYAT